MLQTDPAQQSVAMSRDMIDRLREWGYRDPDTLGQLGADLGDIYAGAARVREILDELVKIPSGQRVRLGELLSDLYEEISHLHQHAESSMPDLDELAEKYDV
jgi:hypothetical protein